MRQGNRMTEVEMPLSFFALYAIMNEDEENIIIESGESHDKN